MPRATGHACLVWGVGARCPGTCLLHVHQVRRVCQALRWPCGIEWPGRGAGSNLLSWLVSGFLDKPVSASLFHHPSFVGNGLCVRLGLLPPSQSPGRCLYTHHSGGLLLRGQPCSPHPPSCIRMRAAAPYLRSGEARDGWPDILGVPGHRYTLSVWKAEKWPPVLCSWGRVWQCQQAACA